MTPVTTNSQLPCVTEDDDPQNSRCPTAQIPSVSKLLTCIINSSMRENVEYKQAYTPENQTIWHLWSCHCSSFWELQLVLSRHFYTGATVVRSFWPQARPVAFTLHEPLTDQLIQVSQSKMSAVFSLQPASWSRLVLTTSPDLTVIRNIFRLLCRRYFSNKVGIKTFVDLDW